MASLRIVGRFVFCLASLTVLLMFTGCTKKMYGAVKFTSSPAGAEVVNLRDDTFLGVSPVVVVWESGDGKPEFVTIQMRKSGYREAISSFWVNTRHQTREKARQEAHPLFMELEPR
jgi:hypothetical protein